MQRVVEPEILDGLPPGDPAAVRSRRDLMIINAFMGNERWILRTVARFPEAAAEGIVEIGAGCGKLVPRLSRKFPDSPVSAVDLIPKPSAVPARVDWRQGDVFDILGGLRGGILVANLFLHHFEPAELKTLGALMAGFRVLVFNEPHRVRSTLLASRLFNPLVNAVTRHDMAASIRAGFTKGELPALLGLERETWQVSESSRWRGSQRMVACRV